MNIDNLERVSCNIFIRMAWSTSYSCMVWFIQSQRPKIDLGEVHRSKCDTLIDVSDQCFTD